MENMTNEKNIIEIKIKDYDDFIRIIQGKDKKYKIDFRKDFIFRGLSNINHKLEPSSIRKNSLNQLVINDYIESDYKFWIDVDKDYAEKNHLEFDLKFHDKTFNTVPIEVDKFGKAILEKNSKFKMPKNILQIKREIYVLIKFLNYVDKSGLKINANYDIRRLIHNLLKYTPEVYWPEKEFINIISLAQHYGIPTRAMDWSYDYKVALYFSVRNILDNNEMEGVVWALNYKLFEDNYVEGKHHEYKLQFYRPEYNINPNLSAQKGLFTFLIDDKENLTNEPLNKIIIDALHDKQRNIESIDYDKKLILVPDMINKEDIIFYKFIIPNKEKAKMLNELYLEGYSEEYLFPGYGNVEINMKNRVKLDDILNNRNKIPRNNLIISMTNEDIVDINKEKKLYVLIKYVPERIDKIFIHSDGEIKGYFKGNQIIKNSPKNLWKLYGKYSGLTKIEAENYFKNCDVGFAIRINDYKNFKYPIKINVNNNFILIKEDSEMNFLLNFR